MSPVAKLLEVFTSVTTWFGTTISSAEPIFWNDTDGLTFVGALSAVGVAVAVTLLVINWIKSFIHLR